MSYMNKVLLLEVGFLICFPALTVGLFMMFGIAGVIALLFLFLFWCWQLFAFGHYRFCRQQEFLYLLQSAAATQAPVESALAVYLEGRPRDYLFRGILLFFVFPGYYWIHNLRSFDARIAQLAVLLERGVPLNLALVSIPGLVSRQTALAVAVGQFTGRLSQALNRLSDPHLPPQWLELGIRMLYSMVILTFLLLQLSFVVIFIIPKFEKIFLEFHMQLPMSTDVLIATSRLLGKYAALLPIVWLLMLVFVNLIVFSSRVKWYLPLLGTLYRMHARGQFLQTLGLMLETGKPLPQILDCVLEAELLPTALASRVERLALDLYEGQPLPDSLEREGLATASMTGLIASAEKANNLPWALQELGDALVRRSARLSYRIVMVLFPLAICVCAGLVAFVSISMFVPLVALIDGMH